jgi:FkbM family methyltransferase
MYAHGDYQGEERRALAGWMRRNGYLKPGRDLVVEVGANIGTTSLPLARDHGCRVLAIEPEPENFALLEANVRNNGLEAQILCESVAVAERSGAGNVLIPVDTSGGVELAEASAVGPPLGSAEIRGVEPVRTAPLSELLREHRIDPSTIAFVWSDAQGSDGHVIATAPELWAAGVPLYMELWPAALRRHGTDDVVADAVRYGFAAFIQSDRLIAHETPAPRPIGELTRLMEGLSGREQTDVLLIP